MVFTDYPLDRIVLTIKGLKKTISFLSEDVRFSNGKSIKKLLTDYCKKLDRDYDELLEIKPLMKHRKKHIMSLIKALKK